MPIFEHEFTIAATTDWQSIRATGLGAGGHLVAGIYRLSTAGSPAAGSLEVKLTDRGYGSSQTDAQMDAIPDGHVFYNEVSIALTASATVGTRTNIEAIVGAAAEYTQSTHPDAELPRSPLLMVRGDGTLAGSVTVTLRSSTPGRAVL